MNETNADFADLTAGQRSSKPGLMDIFLAQQPRLRRIAAGMGLGASDVEDVLQDVSIKALEGPAGLQTKEQSARWLIRVTLNRCLTEHRRRRTFKRHTGQILETRSQTDAPSVQNIGGDLGGFGEAGPKYPGYLPLLFWWFSGPFLVVPATCGG